jgi:lactate dehydrogenase-like 2-hydroxyacid dehydrogenase
MLSITIGVFTTGVKPEEQQWGDMKKPEILQIGPYPDWASEALEKHFVVHRYFEAENREALLRERGATVRGIATRGELGADASLIALLPALEIIAIFGVGYDAVDLQAARARDIRVTNTPDVLTGDVADLAMAMMLAAARNVAGAADWVRQGSWATSGGYPLQSRVFGKRAGILGLGRIGSAIAQRCAGFGMEIAYSDLAPEGAGGAWHFIADPIALAEASDFLFVTLTGGSATRHIVGREMLRALGPDGMLVNVSRASNVDEAALLDALEQRTLGFAALDVFAGEPNIDPRFLALENVLLQPHHASATVETREAMGQLLLENLQAHFSGRTPPSLVV